MNELAARVTRLERGLILGQGGDASTLAGVVDKLNAQVSQLRAARDVGNVVYGGPVKTYIATSAFTTGPFRDSLDATFDVEFDLWVPDYLLRIIRCQMRIKPTAIRSSVKVATATGDLTTNSGGGSTSGGGSSHNHTITGASATGGDHDHSLAGTTGASDGSIGLHSHNLSSGGTNTPGGHSHNVGGYTTNSNTSHTHSVPNHTHVTPGHSHTLTLGIAESGIASQLRFTIDAVDRTAALGGPWDDEAVVDITEYLIDVRHKPVAGAHPILIASDTVGGVEIWFDWYVISKPV